MGSNGLAYLCIRLSHRPVEGPASKARDLINIPFFCTVLSEGILIQAGFFLCPCCACVTTKTTLWLLAQWGTAALICIKGPTVLPTITFRSPMQMSAELKNSIWSIIMNIIVTYGLLNAVQDSRGTCNHVWLFWSAAWQDLAGKPGKAFLAAPLFCSYVTPGKHFICCQFQFPSHSFIYSFDKYLLVPFMCTVCT